LPKTAEPPQACLPAGRGRQNGRLRKWRDDDEDEGEDDSRRRARLIRRDERVCCPG